MSQNSVESMLNDYALEAANQQDLSPYLVGDALKSAIESEELLSELGLIGFGASQFTLTKQLEDDLFESCLDVSATSFRDLAGEIVNLERKERQLVRVNITAGKISNLQLTGATC
jgi:hypothetical protein